jgi:hypothetical protein
VKPFKIAWQCCGTGTPGSRTFSLCGTGTKVGIGMHSGSRSRFGSRSDIVSNDKSKKLKKYENFLGNSFASNFKKAGFCTENFLF